MKRVSESDGFLKVKEENYSEMNCWLRAWCFVRRNMGDSERGCPVSAGRG